MPAEHPSLAARIHGTKALSGSQRRIADCLLAHLHEAAFWGVEELAERSQSSVATVVRFAQKMGYSGFLELRQALVLQARARTAPEARLLQAPKDAASMLVEAARRDMANIERTVQGINEGLLKAVIRRIEGARHRVIVGHGVSRIMAEHLGYVLTVAGLVTVSGSPAEFARQVANLEPKDLLITISLSPYSQETLDVAAYAAKRGVPVIAFTDGFEAPLAKSAEFTLPVATENLLFSNSIAAFSVLAYTLGTAVASRDRKRAIKRFQEAEQVAEPQFIKP